MAGFFLLVGWKKTYSGEVLKKRNCLRSNTSIPQSAFYERRLRRLIRESFPRLPATDIEINSLLPFNRADISFADEIYIFWFLYAYVRVGDRRAENLATECINEMRRWKEGF